MQHYLHARQSKCCVSYRIAYVQHYLHARQSKCCVSYRIAYSITHMRGKLYAIIIMQEKKRALGALLRRSMLRTKFGAPHLGSTPSGRKNNADRQHYKEGEESNAGPQKRARPPHLGGSNAQAAFQHYKMNAGEAPNAGEPPSRLGWKPLQTLQTLWKLTASCNMSCMRVEWGCACG